MPVRALRGATTVDADTPEQVSERTRALVRELLDRNEIGPDDLISVIFTTTQDVISMFPATAARDLGLGDVPLLCAREIPVPGAKPRCIRVLAHVETERSRASLHHVYLEEAKDLRDDLPD